MLDIKAFLFDDDRGVSPVIGVILMVAITVILAAVIAAFVLGLGDTSDPAPSVSFEYELDEGDDGEGGFVTITHESGDTFEASNVEVQGPINGSSEEFSDSVTAGDSIEVSLNNSDDGDPAESGESVDIIFNSDDGESSSRIGSFTLPDSYVNTAS